MISNRNPRFPILCLLTAGLLLRVFLAVTNTGFGNDIACFAAWADRIYTIGPGEFYSSDFFTDYPPGFMYVLYPIGALCSHFQIPAYSGLHLLLLKLPAMLCDILCSFLLYRESCKSFRQSIALVLTASYLFNPAIILNSALWGQVDSVFTLLVACTCLFLMQKRMLPAYITFGIGILIKPQTLVFTPVLLAGILDYVFLQQFTWRKLLHNLLQGILVLCGMVMLCLPFGLEKVLAQYANTLGSYPYVAVNAYNFWGMLGLNWTSQENMLFFLSYQQWGIVIILLIVLFTFLISLKMPGDNSKYPLLGAFIILTMFLFSVRMHERYMYPGLLLLLLYYVHKPHRHLSGCYIAFSLLHLCNTAHVLYCYDPYNYNAKSPFILAVSTGMVLCICWLYYIIVKLIRQPDITSENKEIREPFTVSNPYNIVSLTQKGLPPKPSAKISPITRRDILSLLIITLLYSFFALYDLGDRAAPVTAHEMNQNEYILLDFGTSTSPVTLSYYIAPWHDRTFLLEGRNHTEDDWISLGETTLGSVFTRQSLSLEHSFRYLRLTLQSTQASILDFSFFDASGNLLQPVNKEDYNALFDENGLYSTAYSYRNSMYFDEIYHGRTAYEYLNGLYSYENTHPPLGKLFIALGISLFGMNPFGWRIIGVLFGIAMLPLVYLFGKRITNNTPAAALACTLFAFDFMHLTQTRIATIDVFITFFVMVMYYFMYRYCRMSFYDSSLPQTLLPLGICGVAFGMGFACKWTGAYAGAGLALLFFATLFRRYREYCYACLSPSEATNRISHRTVLTRFVPYSLKTIGFCVVFFIAVPLLIYLLSYIPFQDGSTRGLVEKMVHNQMSMFNYHSDLNATHPFSSIWYEWPVIKRPVWYYSNIVSDTTGNHIREGISAFGNPLVWWLGIPAFCYTVYLALRDKKDSTARFLIIGYLAQYLPWFFVTRITFIYHYFPSVFFVVAMIVYCLTQLKKKISHKAFLIIVSLYGLSAFALFLLFYPVLSGQPVDTDYVVHYLRWFKDWILISG